MAEPLFDPETETIDPFYRGKIRIIQSKKGYRFALDAPILADFVRLEPGEDVCELGTGNGAVAVMLSLKPFRKLTAVEIQPDLAALALRNVALNGLQDRIEIVEADFREWRPGRRFDVVCSNPPYIRKKSGFLSSSPEKSTAKHEIACDIREIMMTAAGLLEPGGRAYFVFRSARETEFRGAASGAGLSVRAFRRVLPSAPEPANLFLARLGFAPGLEDDLPPLVVHGASGSFTPEAEAIFEGGPAARGS